MSEYTLSEANRVISTQRALMDFQKRMNREAIDDMQRSLEELEATQAALEREQTKRSDAEAWLEVWQRWGFQQLTRAQQAEAKLEATKASLAGSRLLADFVQDERNQAREERDEAKREKDELAASLAHSRSLNARLIREKDELTAAVERLRPRVSHEASVLITGSEYMELWHDRPVKLSGAVERRVPFQHKLLAVRFDGGTIVVMYDNGQSDDEAIEQARAVL